MKSINLKIAAAALTAGGIAAATPAVADEQFIPLLVYRTGSFAPLGIPWADGKIDYLKLVNARDGGVNGVKLTFEECETAYATDKGVECYERLKTRGTGASARASAAEWMREQVNANERSLTCIENRAPNGGSSSSTRCPGSPRDGRGVIRHQAAVTNNIP